MTMDVRDTVAKALYSDQAWAPAWEDAPDWWRNRYRTQADRAIEAMERGMTGHLAQALFEALGLKPTTVEFQTLHGILLDHLVKDRREEAA